MIWFFSLKFTLTEHAVYLKFKLLFAKSGDAMGKPAEGPAGTNYSCSFLAHTPKPKCLRLGSQEADRKTKIHVQEIYLKKCSQGRLIGDWGNKAGQERGPTRMKTQASPCRGCFSLTPQGRVSFASEICRRIPGWCADTVIYVVGQKQRSAQVQSLGRKITLAIIFINTQKPCKEW